MFALSLRWCKSLQMGCKSNPITSKNIKLKSTRKSVAIVTLGSPQFEVTIDQPGTILALTLKIIHCDTFVTVNSGHYCHHNTLVLLCFTDSLIAEQLAAAHQHTKMQYLGSV